MKSSNAPFNEFGQSMVLRDIENLFVLVQDASAAAGSAQSSANAAAASAADALAAIEALTVVVGALGTMSTQDANAVAITGGTIDGVTITNLAAPLEVISGGTGLATVAADRFIYTSALNTFVAGTSTAFGRSIMACFDAAAGRTQFALGDMALQAASSVAITGGTITGITDLAVDDGGTGRSTIGADLILYGTGATTYATTSLTSLGRTIIGSSAGSSVRSAIGVNYIGTLSNPIYDPTGSAGFDAVCWMKTTTAFTSASGGTATISGGRSNNASNTDCTVSGGFGNAATAIGATVAGGQTNTASGTNAFAVGTANLASGFVAAAIGSTNTASSSNCIAIGWNCTATAANSYAIGHSANAVFADSMAMGATCTTTAINQLLLGFTAIETTVGSFKVATGFGYYVNNIKVVGDQGAAVTSPSGGATVDTQARTAINTIIGRLQAHGLIA